MTRQMTIIELEKEFLSSIRAIGMDGYHLIGGSMRGNRQVLGPSVIIHFAATMKMTKCLRKKLRRLVKKFYGPCKRPVLRQGRVRFSGPLGESRRREITIEFEKGVDHV